MTRTNGQWRLASRPIGMVKESDFEYVEEPVRELVDGEVVVRNLYLAFEPAMRGWLDDVPSYIPPVQIGEVMRASTVGQVVESKHPDMGVRRKADLGAPDEPGAQYILRWETLPSNRDRPRPGDPPEPSMLRLYKLRKP